MSAQLSKFLCAVCLAIGMLAVLLLAVFDTAEAGQKEHHKIIINHHGHGHCGPKLLLKSHDKKKDDTIIINECHEEGHHHHDTHHHHHHHHHKHKSEHKHKHEHKAKHEHKHYEHKHYDHKEYHDDESSHLEHDQPQPVLGYPIY